jgi:hypothetical protein
MIGWMSLALAAVPGQDDYTPPALDVELARPVRDGRWTTATETGRVAQGPYAGLVGTHLSQPVRWRDHQGEHSAIVAGASGGYLLAGVGSGRLQLGLTAPVWVDVRGAYWEGGATVLGDPSADLALGLVGTDTVAVALTSRLGASLGGAARMVGAGGWSGEVGAAADLQPGVLRAAADLRLRFQPQLRAHDLVQDDVAVVHAALGVAPVGDLTAAVEWLARPSLRGGAPLVSELMLTAGHGPATGWGLLGSVGRGVTAGVGSPRWHATLALRYRGGAPSPR